MGIKRDDTDNKKRKDGRDEKKFRAYFVRLFGKWNIRNERQFVHFAKWLIFACFIVVEAFLLLDYASDFFAERNWVVLGILLGVSGLLLLSEGLKLFVMKDKRGQIVFFVVDVLAACCFMFVAGGGYAVAVYMLVFTELYISTERPRISMGLLLGSVGLYVGSHLLQTLVINPRAVELYTLLTNAFSGSLALVLHFIVMQVGIAFYRQFLRLDKALTELDQSKKELEKAYEAVAEVTALEERQRIAKEIHDTAGHSITTVIMQTEAAKLIVDHNPAEAKGKIVAANLQAKHALEELRDSVHLLSGVRENQTLKQALEDIIHESTDGTGIAIRSDIRSVEVSPAKFRFLCNTLKEGVSNGLRHGDATAFWFECKEEDGKIFFLLSDNGKGIQTDGLHMGFGLTSMQERAKSLGGEVTFVSETDEGFELKLILPADAE